ncbi:PTS transporter subunit EIIC [Streptococcus suis]
MNFKKFSQLGQAFMLPISILPVAGLLLGIGGALSNSNTVAQFPVLDQAWLQAVFTIMSTAGSAVFANLALIFAIGVAVGLADADKGTAGLSAGVAYLVYTATISGFLTLFADKGASIDTGVLGALAIGITVATLHNKYRKIELPAFLGFFGGSRFIPIISSFAAIAIGSIFYIIWPPIQNLLVDFGKAIAEMGSFGTFLYGFGLRLTGAFGLHHTIYPMFWYTSLGGSEVVAGETIQGAQNIFFAQLADANHTGLFTYGTRFFAGRFATMIFGLPASCLAMYHAIPKENRKKVGSFYSSSALTSLLTGITEPIEFSFLFVAPWLYVVHAFLDGLSFLVADLLQIRIGNSFSGGLIDYLIFGVFQGNDKTNWIYVIPVGLLWAAVYYLVFKFLVTKFHVLVPGMESSDQASHSEKVLSNGSSLRDNAIAIIDALGGPDNIEHVTACATRLRVSLRNSGLVDKGVIQSIGATAVLDVKGGIQAIFGGKAILYSQEINQILGLEE